MIAVAGTATTALWLGAVMPHFREGAEPAFYGRYDAVGGSPAGIVKTAVTDPLAIADAVTERRDLLYLVELGLPLAALFLLAPLALIAAVPELLANLLSSVGNQTSIRFHYTAPITPFLFAAAILGASQFVRRREAAAAILAFSLLAGIVIGPLRAGELVPEPRSDHDRIAERAVALIPPDVPGLEHERPRRPPVGAPPDPQLSRRLRLGVGRRRPEARLLSGQALGSLHGRGAARGAASLRLVVEGLRRGRDHRPQENGVEGDEQEVADDDEPDDSLQRKDFAVVEEPQPAGEERCAEKRRRHHAGNAADEGHDRHEPDEVLR